MANERVDISTPVAKRCFQIAEAKQSSLIVAADLNTGLTKTVALGFFYGGFQVPCPLNRCFQH